MGVGYGFQKGGGGIMQEVEYRGKSIKTNEWVYGYLVKQFGKFKIYNDSKEDFGEWLFEVVPETLGQYIGIKDILNRKVYIGDIVKIKRLIFEDCHRKKLREIDEYIGEIVWHQFGWHLAEKIKDGTRYHSFWLWNIKDDESDPDTHFMEIIGDRWDNPEMKVIE